MGEGTQPTVSSMKIGPMSVLFLAVSPASWDSALQIPCH